MINQKQNYSIMLLSLDTLKNYKMMLKDTELVGRLSIIYNLWHTK